MSDAKASSRFAVSLRFLLLCSTAIFVVGYQQYQIRQLQHSLEEVQTTSADLRSQLKQKAQAVQIITTPVTVPVMGQGQGRLRFPIEVERAMMGDSFQITPASPQIR